MKTRMQRHGLSLLALVLAGLIALASSPALAQTQATGVIEGRVIDDAGDPVPGATVQVAQADGSYPKGAVTDASGAFRVPFLPPGLYNIVVQAPGFSARTVEGLRVSASSAQKIDIAVIGEITEEVTVTAAPPLIDKVRTEETLILGSRQIERLPVQRDVNQLIEFTPGARDSARLFGGVNDQANSYQLDGVSVNQPGFGGDFLLPNIDWIEEFQVRGLGAGAEYGNFQGGLINIVTKSGTNTFKANLRANYSSSSLNASNVNVEEDGAETDLRWELNGDVSGPLIKDKLWYFFSVQNIREDTRVVDEQASGLSFLDTQEERTEQKFYGKLTWQATEADSFNFYLGWDGVETENRGISTFTEAAATTTQDSPSWFYNLSWQHIFNDSLFLEAKLNGYQGEDDRIPKNGDSRQSVQILGGTRSLFRNATFTRTREPESLGLSVNLDWFLESGATKHQLKFGGEWVEGSWRETRTRHAGLTWRPIVDDEDAFDPNDPATWDFISSDWGGNINLDAETLNAALYVQDYAQINEHFSVNAGLRYGRWEGELTPGFGGGPSFDTVKDEAFDPRIGFAYDFTGDAEWVLKGHWGTYHQSLIALMFDRTEGGNVFTNEEFWDWDPFPTYFDPDLDFPYRNPGDNPDLWVFFGDNPLGDEVGPIEGYDQPYVEQLVLSLEHAFSDRFKMGLTWVERKNKNIISLVDKNLDDNFTKFTDVTVVSGGNTFVLPELYLDNRDVIFEGGAPGVDPEDVDFERDFALTNPSGARRELEQIQLTAEYFAPKWTLAGSLVWTDLIGNFNSVSGYADPTGQLGAGGYVNPNEQINWDGRLPNSSRWEGKVRFTAELPYGFRVGSFLRYFSGDFYTALYEIDRREDSFFLSDGTELNPFLLFEVNGQEVFAEKRGSRRYDDEWTLDLRAEKEFSFGDLDWIVAVDVFNVANNDATTRVDPLINFGTFNDVRRRQNPREVRISTSLHW